MFRKPREGDNPTLISPLVPSTGRPPTPPSSISRMSKPMPNVHVNVPMAGSVTPLLGRSKTLVRGGGKSPMIGMGKAKGKTNGKTNGNIMNFFKKADSLSTNYTGVRQKEESLFLDDWEEGNGEDLTQTPTPPREDLLVQEPLAAAHGESNNKDSSRFNENIGASKRRRLETSPTVRDPMSVEGNSQRRRPFIDDSGDEEEERMSFSREDSLLKAVDNEIFSANAPVSAVSLKAALPVMDLQGAFRVPHLKRESTSLAEDNDFDGIEDFVDDEFPEDGEEFVERRWMEEQELKLGLGDEQDPDVFLSPVKEEPMDSLIEPLREKEAARCPVCNVNFADVADEDASIHVNNCLDGNPTPLPQPPVTKKAEPVVRRESGALSAKRFQRAAIARPGQDNPFSLDSSNLKGSSAFSQLMSSHAEDAAWATAAASEMASRGKPAYQRTCPFYKILPGLFICVDAFRYGAVEGCKAYFLSHFHSDHYIGLTSSWCHGPIYCSRVTANLVRQQLRVDPKWVFDLDFDRKIEVPCTQGVDVTMIPANHCPGSSLYLFEKVIGKGKNPKVHRILHCGDFRACPAHVQHPLLRPDALDAATGKATAQQKLDVCYLDTTYLTPKYAFPSQEEVIKACADMCVSLSKDQVDETDDWEKTKKERAGNGMVKFVRKDSTLIKEEIDEDDIDAMKVNINSGKRSRGRLLVIVGTYSIGKERICLGVARALNSKIYAPPNKQKICAALEDPELSARLTNDPLEAQVHMQMLMEIRAETLTDYLTGYKPHFSRIVGFRPSGWNYRPPNSRFVESPAVQTVLYSDNWKSRYSMAELVPQRGSTREASCFGVPYSEHSSFRELTMFCCALRIDKIIPTVNVGSAKSREKMKAWCEKWAVEKKKNGLFKVGDGQTAW